MVSRAKKLTRAEKVVKSGRSARNPVTFEQLVEALQECRGFVLAAKKYIKKKWGIEVSHSVLRVRIKEWGMEDFIQEIRESLVEDCLQRTFSKAIAEGDNHCIFWVLGRYGHHTDFLDTVDSETESKKGWKEILVHVKSSVESNTD